MGSSKKKKSSSDKASKHDKRKKHKSKKKKNKDSSPSSKSKKETSNKIESDTFGPLPPPNIGESSTSRNLAPMTKEEWDKKQSVTKRVFDESTGRYRLIKGDGEVIEEIVSRDRQQQINKQATRGDGEYFQNILSSSSKN